MHEPIQPTEKDVLRKRLFGRTANPLTMNEWLRLTGIWRVAMATRERKMDWGFFQVAFDNNRYALERAENLMGLRRI